MEPPGFVFKLVEIYLWIEGGGQEWDSPHGSLIFLNKTGQFRVK